MKRCKMREEIRRDILAETYVDMQNLIFAVVWQVWMCYGGDIDDLASEANLIFLNIIDEHDPDRGELSTWLAYKIKKELLSHIRIKSRHLLSCISIDDELIETDSNLISRDFSVMDFVDEMSQDAHIILQLFLEIPRDVLSNLLEETRRIDRVQAHVRNRLKNRLRQMGWTTQRMKTAFEQIKNIIDY